MINQSIFKSYDVRGIYPSDLNEEAAFAIGRAFVKFTGAKNVVVGYDARLSSPALFKSLTQGLFAQGAQVTTIGQTPTEGIYFAVASYNFDAGIMITASHNPKEYNGFKMMVKKDNDIVWVRGKELLSMAEIGDVKESSDAQVKDLNIWPDYIKHILTFFGDSKPFKIAVDASNGVMGSVIEMIKDKLPCEILPLNFEPDGSFPNHSPNPLEEGASAQIAQKITSEKADFGFIFDADADRIFLVDEHGVMVSADVVLLLLAKHFLEKNPGRGIAYNLICSRSVPEFVAKWGGVPIRTQVGFVNVRQGLIDNNGVMGGELSAHYCFADYFYCDSGMIALLTLLQIISKEGKPVSQIVKELSIYAPPAQVNFQIEDKQAVLEKIKAKYVDLPAPRPNTFYVYVIKCDDESLYIGQTQDLQKRWKEHEAGNGADWIKKHKPLYIAHYEEYSTREEAVKREQDLKTGFGRKWLKREIESGRARQAGGKQDYLDGVTVEYDNWWFNLRPSNTEPLLKLTIEASTQELLDEKKQELNNSILENI